MSELIDNFTVEKLLEERISKPDCEFEGYVLEGYPKTK
jgi:adenylate kinase family enzyme